MFRRSVVLAALTATTFAQSTTTSSSNATATSDIGVSSNSLQGILFGFDRSGSRPVDPVEGFDASRVCQDDESTTYVLRCAETGSPVSLCSQNPTVAITITAGPTNYEMIYTTRAAAVATVTATCDFDGPSESATQAVCTESGWIAARGSTATLLDTTQTYGTGTDTIPPVATIPVTSGEANISASGSCPATPTTLSPITQGTSIVVGTGNAGASSNAAPSGTVKDVYKVLVPVGAAAFAFVV